MIEIVLAAYAITIVGGVLLQAAGSSNERVYCRLSHI